MILLCSSVIKLYLIPNIILKSNFHITVSISFFKSYLKSVLFFSSILQAFSFGGRLANMPLLLLHNPPNTHPIASFTRTSSSSLTKQETSYIYLFGLTPIFFNIWSVFQFLVVKIRNLYRIENAIFYDLIIIRNY